MNDDWGIRHDGSDDFELLVNLSRRRNGNIIDLPAHLIRITHQADDNFVKIGLRWWRQNRIFRCGPQSRRQLTWQQILGHLKAAGPQKKDQ